MYLMNKDTYECDFCGWESAWDGSDAEHGTLWGCDRCDKTFCGKCAAKRIGQRSFDYMLQCTDEVLCPDCWEHEHGSKSKAVQIAKGENLNG